MKRIYATICGLTVTICLTARTSTPKETVVNMEEPEGITSISDIIRMEEQENNASQDMPCKGTSSHESYLKLGYNLAKLVPDEKIPLGCGYNYDLAPHFKANWGIGLQIGHDYRVHKEPVAGMLWFNVDAVFADFSFNHYSTEKGEYVYDSSRVWTGTGTDGATVDYRYLPWCLEKYEVNFGMSVGPSITIDPFRQNPELKNLTFNVFYHIGYHASLMWMQNDISLDGSQYGESAYNPVNDSLKLTYGHGFMNSFGFNVNWRMLGIGIEKRYGYLNYRAMQKDLYGDRKYRFIDDETKFYVQVKF